MDTRIDFLRWLEFDVVLKILMYLTDAADLMRASAVSHYWRAFVVANGLCKKLCLRNFPQLASITHVIETTRSFPDLNSDPAEQDIAHAEHRAYASLLQALRSFPPRYCTSYPVSASSTDNYPQESIVNTLDPRDRILNRLSYWSSKGNHDPEVPESLIYYLNSNLSLITEIDVAPFQAMFQPGFPIYSAKFVRFRMGHPKSIFSLDRDFIEEQEDADDRFIWTYTSEMFPMAQENRLQCFRLPEPVLCIGGYLQVQLLGRVEKQIVDEKYFICVSHVQAIGRELSPAFSVEFPEPPDATYLKYDAEELNRAMRDVSAGYYSHSTHLLPMQPLPMHLFRDFVWGNFQDFVDMVQQEQDGLEFGWFNADFLLDDDEDDDAGLAFIL